MGEPVVEPEPVAYQYLGPGAGRRFIMPDPPKRNHAHWYPLYRSPTPLAEQPERQCSLCGLPESETDWDSLTDIRVVVRYGEEGFSDVMMLLCDLHATQVIDSLIDLGFKDHYHGTTDSLEDRDCPGSIYEPGCPGEGYQARFEGGYIVPPPPTKGEDDG